MGGTADCLDPADVGGVDLLVRGVSGSGCAERVVAWADGQPPGSLANVLRSRRLSAIPNPRIMCEGLQRAERANRPCNGDPARHLPGWRAPSTQPPTRHARPGNGGSRETSGPRRDLSPIYRDAIIGWGGHVKASRKLAGWSDQPTGSRPGGRDHRSSTNRLCARRDNPGHVPAAFG